VLPRFNLIDVIGEAAVHSGVQEAWSVAKETLKATKTVVASFEGRITDQIEVADHAARMRGVEHIHQVSGVTPSKSERAGPTGPTTINVQINYGIAPPQMAPVPTAQYDGGAQYVTVPRDVTPHLVHPTTETDGEGTSTG